jgi:hypothetical protein
MVQLIPSYLFLLAVVGTAGFLEAGVEEQHKFLSTMALPSKWEVGLRHHHRSWCASPARNQGDAQERRRLGLRSGGHGDNIRRGVREIPRFLGSIFRVMWVVGGRDAMVENMTR